MKIGFDGKRAVQNYTGLGNYSRYLVDALCQFSPNNTYTLYAPKHISNARLSSIVNKHSQILRIKYPHKMLWKLFSAIWRIIGSKGALKHDHIDIFHGLSNELPLNIRNICGVKSVVTIHDLIFLRLPGSYKFIDRTIYNYKARKACDNADKIIAISECTKRDIMAFYNVPDSKIAVIYQGCDPAFSEPVSDSKRTEVRLRYNLPSNYLLSVGSIEERKNALTIVKALEHLPESHKLVIVGRHTKYADRIANYIAERNLSHRVKMIHNVPFADLPSIYQMADTFIYTSLYEGFGIPILEALNSRIPVVAATGSCLEEAGGPRSIYVDPYDVKATAEAITATLDPSTRANMIATGLEWAKRFSQKQMAEETIAIYRELLNGE